MHETMTAQTPTSPDRPRDRAPQSPDEAQRDACALHAALNRALKAQVLLMTVLGVASYLLLTALGAFA